jgi:histidinol-phosphate aminotransferase
MSLVPHYIEVLRPYEAGCSADDVRREFGLSRVVKLASNENPLGPSPLALEAVREKLDRSHVYPRGGVELRAVLAQEYGAKIDNVIVGSGSDSIISNIVRTFLGDRDEILTTEAAFVGFQTVAKSRGVPYRTVPLRQWQYDLEALADGVNENTKIIYLANPNNPTGTIFTRQQFEAFYKHIPERVLIILDEAYFEYAKYDPRYPDSMHYRLDNVITLRTFSKVYGLAGLRVGYGFAHEDLIRNLLKVKLPFEPSSLAEAAGIAALRDKAFLHRSLEMNIRGMEMMSAGLQSRGFEVVPSEANFVMAVLSDSGSAHELVEGLLRLGVIIRPLGAFGLPKCVRISIGTDEENQICLEAIDQVTSGSHRLQETLVTASKL